MYDTRDRNRKRSNPILRLHHRLENEENRRSGADVFLAKMFSSIAWSHGLAEKTNGQLRWYSLLNQYIKKLERIRFNKMQQSGKGEVTINVPDKNSVRGNIQKQLSSPKMTWNVFCSAMRFLQIARIDVRFRVYTWDGKSTDHEKTLHFSRNDDETFLSEIATKDNANELKEDSEMQDASQNKDE